MNEVETPAEAPGVVKRRRGLLWLIVLIVLLAAGNWLLTTGLSQDPRLVGEWESERGTVRRFHPDGRHEQLMPIGSTRIFSTAPKVWFIEKGQLVISSQRSVEGRFASLKRWIQNFFGRQKGALALGFSDERYEIVEQTETTLKLRLIRPPRAPQPPIEKLQKMPAK